jgi:DUF1680 family protein
MTNRRKFLSGAATGLGGALLARSRIFAADSSARGVSASLRAQDATIEAGKRFPYFQSEPLSYLNVRMQDGFWAPRQKTTHDVSLQWITSHHDPAGGLEEFKKHPQTYVTETQPSETEHVKFIEAMSTVLGVQRDPSIAGLIDAWAKPLIEGQAADGYLGEHFPPGIFQPAHRWEAVSWSLEDYNIGNYLEAAIAYREVTGSEAMYRSAVRAADNMAAALLDGHLAYAPATPEIEQALMRLYGMTGNTTYLRLCGWLLDQRGHHEGRPNYGRNYQDHIPVRDQRTIEGHAVRAAFLFNGVTHYVGATGDAAYREAVLSVWDDLMNRKMYLHGAGGNKSARNEGYRKNPYCILPDDTYGESCSVFANFQWAHSLFRLTSDARYIDAAERMLYNAFYASLSLKGDSSFYCNVAQYDVPLPPDEWVHFRPTLPRSSELATSCCPPNIVKLFNKVGGFFYSTDQNGIYVNHYGACEANIPWGGGVKLTQRTGYPWDGTITILVEPKNREFFTLRLRVPAWAKSHRLSVNGKAIDITPQKGLLVIHRHWKAGDQVELSLPMEIERVTMPPQFSGYENRVALQRGPIVYCLEEQDLGNAVTHATLGLSLPVLPALYVPVEAKFTAEHQPDLLGGITVLRGEVRQINSDNSEKSVLAMFVPYGVWGNRAPSTMRIWLGAGKAPLIELLAPELQETESCVG